MDIEGLATSAVRKSISMTDTMTPYINNGDREPVYDGHIYIYGDAQKRRDNLKRVPVQIKGKQCNKQNSNTIRFPVKVSALEDYLSNGGVMFFVVYIDSTGQKTQIYYSGLQVIKLRLILSEVKKGQTTKTIELKKFPDDNIKKTSILLNFFEHKQRQTSFAHAKLLSEEELVCKGLLESISFTATEFGTRKNDLPASLFEEDLYVYANIKGFAIPQPLEQVGYDLHVAQEIVGDILIGSNKYYDHFTKVQSKGVIEYYLGHSFEIRFDSENKIMRVSLKPNTILEYVIEDSPFLLELSVAKEVSINGRTLYLNNIQQILNAENVSHITSRYNECLKIGELFKRLKLNTNVDLSKMSKADIHNTYRLIEGLINCKPVSGLNPDTPHAAKIDYLGGSIALVFTPTSNSGEFYLSDFFTCKEFEVYRIIDEQKCPASRFVRLTPEDFLGIINIDYDSICNSFMDYSDEPYCFDDANTLLLQMLLAYDRSDNLRRDILDAAKHFSDAVIANTAKTEYEQKIYRINALQIARRIGDLSQEQKHELVRLVEGSRFSDVQQEYRIKFGANLLLGNHATAKYFFDLLPIDEQKAFRDYPIFRFWSEEA